MKHPQDPQNRTADGSKVGPADLVVEAAGRDAHGRRMFRVVAETSAAKLAQVREEIRATEAHRADLVARLELLLAEPQGRA